MRDNIKHIAALALFRELYDKEKNIYDIIFCFIMDVVISNNFQSFSSSEITKVLNDTFQFELLDATIVKALKSSNFIKKENGKYFIIDSSKLDPYKSLFQQHDTTSHTSEILSSLIDYTRDKLQRKLNESEVEIITNDFYAFIIDKSSNSQFKTYISAFIIQNHGSEILDTLQKIKEGVILYSAIKYDNNLNNSVTWNTTLTIFLDTEILFHIAGYNGVLNNKLVNDFLALVNEINKKNKYITLKYLPSVEKEIETYFLRAKTLLSNRSKVSPLKSAMNYIVECSKTPSDLIELQAKFKVLIKNKGISLDTETELKYSIQENHKFHISSSDDLIAISHKYFNDKDLSGVDKGLVLINILRGGKQGNWEETNFILLTGNFITLKLSRLDAYYKNVGVPLTTDLNFLTDRLWYKLGKGFGGNGAITSFDILVKAQLSLSSALNTAISDKFEKLLILNKENELSDEIISLTISSLRDKVKLPEEINDSVIEEILIEIEEHKINQYVEEFQHTKALVSTLSIANKEKDNRIKNLEKKEEIRLRRISRQNNRIKYKRHLRIKTILNIINGFVTVTLILIFFAPAVFTWYFYHNDMLDLKTSKNANIFILLMLFLEFIFSIFELKYKFIRPNITHLFKSIFNKKVKNTNKIKKIKQIIKKFV